MQVPLNDLGRHLAGIEAALSQALQRVAKSGRLVLGPEVAAFEASFAEYCGVAHCLGVANGSDALTLALQSLGCGRGDEVATVANAGGYATLSILATGATPLYIDIDAKSLNMSPIALRDTITPRTKVVVVTHLFGRLAEMTAIEAATRAVGAVIVEDCAQAHGARRDGRFAGSFGAAACFSFYPSKNLGALGDAGAIVTDDTALAGRLGRLRQYGWQQRFVVAEPGGRNSRLDEIQAAVLSAQLPFLDDWNERRRRVVGRYREGLAGEPIVLPALDDDEAYVAHLCVARSPQRDRLRAELLVRGVATDIHYPLPDYAQTTVAPHIGAPKPLPETERSLSEIITLPCFPEMTDDEVDYVIDAIRQVTSDRRL